jgi:hypothetical protein
LRPLRWYRKLQAMNPKLLLLALFSLPLFLSGCGFVKGKDEAEKVAAAFFEERIAQGGFGGDRFYSKEFWEYTEEEKRDDIKAIAADAHGRLRTYALNSWNVQSKYYAVQLSGTFVTLLYDTSYEKGSAQEKLTLFRPVGSEEYKLLGLNIASDDIQALIRKGIENAAESASSEGSEQKES